MAEHIQRSPSYGSIRLVRQPHARGDSHDDDDDDDDDDDSSNDSHLILSAERQAERAKTFTIPFDKDRGYRATELNFSSFDRPHMRAFHGSWMSVFVSYYVQFAMSPLLPDIQQSLGLTLRDIWLTNIWSVVGGIPMKFLLGPLCDKYGSRLIIVTMLAATAMLCALSGLVMTLNGLIAIRFAMGCMEVLVPSQYWVTCHFVRDISGSAAAISSGLGASGSAVSQLMVGSILFPLFFYITGGDDDLSWRYSLIFPALLSFVTAVFFFFFSEDSPLGNFEEVKRAGLMIERSAMDSFRSGALNLNSWLLFLQFAGSFGVDTTMCNGTAIYYHERFHQSTAASAAIASLYGITAIFARGLGGYFSDTLSETMSMRGRLWAQMISMLVQGSLTILWARMDTVGSSIFVMVVFSILVSVSMGTCYAIVPYIDGPNTGSVSGIVGAGGSVGAVILGNVFRSNQIVQAAERMGMFTIALALLTPLIVIRGYRGLLFGKDEEPRMQPMTLLTPR